MVRPGGGVGFPGNRKPPLGPALQYHIKDSTIKLAIFQYKPQAERFVFVDDKRKQMGVISYIFSIYLDAQNQSVKR